MDDMEAGRGRPATISEDGLITSALLALCADVLVMLGLDGTGELAIDLALENLDRFEALAPIASRPGAPWDLAAAGVRRRAKARLEAMRPALAALAQQPPIMAEAPR